MLKSQSMKHVPLKLGTIATNATAAYTIDRLGFDYAKVKVAMAPASATNSADEFVVLKLMEGDTSDVSSAANITDFVGTTNSSATTGFVIQHHNSTANPQTHEFCVDCRGRKRYLFVVAQGDADNATIYVEAELSRAKQLPNSDTKRNVALTVIG
jgi:hypothetical protein